MAMLWSGEIRCWGKSKILSYTMLMGFSDKSIKSQAISGTSTYRSNCASFSTNKIYVLLLGRCLIWLILSKAIGSKARQLNPKVVSVGVKITPEFCKISTAFCIQQNYCFFLCFKNFWVNLI